MKQECDQQKCDLCDKMSDVQGRRIFEVKGKWVCRKCVPYVSFALSGIDYNDRAYTEMLTHIDELYATKHHEVTIGFKHHELEMAY